MFDVKQSVLQFKIAYVEGYKNYNGVDEVKPKAKTSYYRIV